MNKKLFLHGFVKRAIDLGFSDSEIADLFYAFELKQAYELNPKMFESGVKQAQQNVMQPQTAGTTTTGVPQQGFNPADATIQPQNALGLPSNVAEAPYTQQPLDPKTLAQTHPEQQPNSSNQNIGVQNNQPKLRPLVNYNRQPVQQPKSAQIFNTREQYSEMERAQDRRLNKLNTWIKNNPGDPYNPRKRQLSLERAMKLPQRPRGYQRPVVTQALRRAQQYGNRIQTLSNAIRPKHIASDEYSAIISGIDQRLKARGIQPGSDTYNKTMANLRNKIKDESFVNRFRKPDNDLKTFATKKGPKGSITYTKPPRQNA